MPVDKPTPVSNPLRRALDFASTERYLVGMSLFRIVCGLTILYQYLINYHDRSFLYGPDAAFPYEIFVDRLASVGSFSIYALSESPVFFDAMFHLGVAVTAVWIIGFKTRWLTPLVFVFVWSLHERHPMLWDGGDNIVHLCLIYAIFANVGARFSIDAMSRRDRGQPHYGLAMAHNAAVLAIAIQVCLVYGVAGLTKVQGETWRSGTAIFYALSSPEFFTPGVSDRIYADPYIGAALSYLTVAFQVAFPFLLFLGGRAIRMLAVAGGLLMHANIGAVMGLVTFAGFMVSVDLVLLTDREYGLVAGFCRRQAAKVRRLASAIAGAVAPPPKTSEEETI